MFFSKKRLSLMLFCVYSLLAVIEYIPHHIFSLTGNPVASYIYLAISAVVDFLLPPLLATVMLVRWGERGGRMALDGLLVSSSRIFFYLPYFYMTFYSMGIDSGEAILLGALVSVGAALAFFGFTVLLFLFARLMHRSQRAREGISVPVKESLPSALRSGGVLDFSAKAAPILFVMALASFIVNLPIVDTVSLIVNYGDSLRFAEILTVILDAVIQLVLFVLTHFICFKFKDALLLSKE